MKGEMLDVIKLNMRREETWRYSGEVLFRSPEKVVLVAYFNRPDLPFHGITFRENDRFVEAYYADRWYNIFEIHDRDTDEVKGWYSNVCRPAEWGAGSIAYVDLALDLLAFPDGRTLALDEDEFVALDLDAATERQARAALSELQALAASGGLANELVIE